MERTRGRGLGKKDEGKRGDSGWGKSGNKRCASAPGGRGEGKKMEHRGSRSETGRNRANRNDNSWEKPDKNGTGRSLKTGGSRNITSQKARGKGMGQCPVMRQCGGCQLLDMKYEEQLKMKQKRLEELLKGLCPVKGIIGMENPLHYRNKVHAVFDRDRRGNIISGIYQENSHVVVPVEKCLIEDEKADEIIGTIRGMLKSFKIRTYDEDTGYGFFAMCWFGGDLPRGR